MYSPTPNAMNDTCNKSERDKIAQCFFPTKKGGIVVGGRGEDWQFRFSQQ